MSTVESAVLGVNPVASLGATGAPIKKPRATKKAVAPATEAAPKRGRGQPPKLLKNGQTYAEAKKAATAKVVAAKQEKAKLKDAHKMQLKHASELNRALVKANRDLAAAEKLLAKSPKDALAKEAVKHAKAHVKDVNASIKAQAKNVAAAIKAVDKAHNAYEAATAAKLKVEEQKLQTVK